MPPKDSQVASARKSFAPKGSVFEVALAKGGPNGLFVYAHLHGIHNDRTGHTDYACAAFLRDDGGYYYAVLPALRTEVKGKTSKPDRHRHCSGQFVFPSEESKAALQTAIAAGAKITIEIAATRDRTDGLKELAEKYKDEVKGMVVQYLAKQVGADQLLDKLNEGKSPKK